MTPTGADHPSSNRSAQTVRTSVFAGGLAVLLVVLAYGTYKFRRDFIRAFFVEGEGGASAPQLALPDDPELAERGLEPAERVRVVLIDGVRADDSRSLPNYSAVCDAGMWIS